MFISKTLLLREIMDQTSNGVVKKEATVSKNANSRKHSLNRPQGGKPKKQKTTQNIDKEVAATEPNGLEEHPPDKGMEHQLVDEQKRREECLDNMEKIEKEFTDLKEKFFAEKIASLKKELELLKSGEHVGFKEAAKALEEKKNSKVCLAEQWRQYQENNIRIAFDSDTKQAEDEFENDKRELLEKMIKSTVKRRKQLEDEKNTLNLTGRNGHEAVRTNPYPTRKLRKRGATSTKNKEIEKKINNHKCQRLRWN